MIFGKKKAETVSVNRPRQYMVRLQRWRSIAALCACSVTLIATLASIGYALVRYMRLGWQPSDYFRYFTTLSNILTAFAAAFIIPYAINGIRKKYLIYPHWLSIMHFAGTVGVSLTFLFTMAFILPANSTFAVGNENLFLHVICPIAVLISFLMVESGRGLTKTAALVSTIPAFVYSLVYLVLVVFVGESQGGWEDLYQLNTFIPIYISLPLMWLLTAGIAFSLRLLFNRISRRRRARMLFSWGEELDPVEVNIEIYGLGRFYGLHGEKNGLDIPYDILEDLANKYHMDVYSMIRVYVKGLYDGTWEKSR